MSKIISYLFIFNILVFSCSLPAMQNGENNKRPSIPEGWRRMPAPGSANPEQPSGQRMHRATAKPAKPCLSRRRFMDPTEDQPEVKTRTFRCKNLEPADWETAQRYFGEESSSLATQLDPGENLATSTEPVRRFFMQRITDFIKSPYGATIVATTVATAAVMIGTYLQHKSAQVHKK